MITGLLWYEELVLYLFWSGFIFVGWIMHGTWNEIRDKCYDCGRPYLNCKKKRGVKRSP